MSDLEHYLPHLEAARAAGLEANQQLAGFLPIATDLLDGEPGEERPLAVVIVEARIQRRDREERQIQLPRVTVEGLPAAPPPPPEWPREHRARYLLERHGELTDCEGCERPRGKHGCTTCATRGYILQERGENTIRIECVGCAGEGWVECATCGGAGDAEWVRLMVERVELHQLRYAYVPSLEDHLDLEVGKLFEELPSALPASLTFDLAPQRQESAYRGAQGQRDDAFHGHGFGDALDRARNAIAGIRRGGEVLHEEVKAYAWPLLWLRYRSLTKKGDVVLLRSPVSGAWAAIRR